MAARYCQQVCAVGATSYQLNEVRDSVTDAAEIALAPSIWSATPAPGENNLSVGYHATYPRGPRL